MTPAEAREYWKALMDNGAALLADAHLLLEAESHGRARSLTVLAQEELGKALWVYDVFRTAWNLGDTTPRTVDRLAQHGRDHIQKYLEASTFGNELAWFWGDYSSLRAPEGETPADARARREREAKDGAKVANQNKQRGFYVDRGDEGELHSPTTIEPGTIADDLQIAAQVIEMLLITDHSRMKHEAVTPYDSTHEQQVRLLPISHPEDWQAAVHSALEGEPSDE